MKPEFKSFPKIVRARNAAIQITEKIDGTNAQIWISDDLSVVAAGSRNRWIEVGDDNYGFAGWVAKHQDELRGLGPGHHYGEWWGCGINRGYDISERRFSLFDAFRWTLSEEEAASGKKFLAPKCCLVVPVLYTGVHDKEEIEKAVNCVRALGSLAEPGFMRPEGVVVYWFDSKSRHKILLEHDDLPKSVAEKITNSQIANAGEGGK